MKSNNIRMVCFLAIASLDAASASIYRCTEPGGGITYQETACAGVATGGTVNIPTAYPDYNVGEHERILQREALLDERLLRRNAIDSAERIAREDRAAREKEAEARIAEADAQAAGGGYPFFAAGRPFAGRHPPHHSQPKSRDRRPL